MTLQAPHSLAPQPKCGPVMPSRPRRMASSDESGSASTSVSTPLRRKRTLGIEDLDPDLILLRLAREFLHHFRPLRNIPPQIFPQPSTPHRTPNPPPSPPTSSAL